MAVIRQGEADRVTRDAIVLNLGDLTRQGDRIRARAVADAEGILTRAAVERQRVLAGARDEGLAKGLAEGRKQGLDEGLKQGLTAGLAERRDGLTKLEAAWGAALDEFVRERDAMLLSARQDVLQLAVMMGERVTRRKIEVDPEVISAQMEAVLGLLAKPTRLTVTVSAQDEALAKDAVPSLLARFSAAQHIDLVVDSRLSAGSCVASTAGGGLIDATIPTQIDRMVAAIMPGAVGTNGKTTATPATNPSFGMPPAAPSEEAGS